MTIKRWIQFDTGGSLSGNQTLANSWITSINTLLGFGGANTKTTTYGANFTYNTNFARVEVLDNLYTLLSSSDKSKCYEDFPNLITLTSPTNEQAYQRNGSDQANILITGTYSGINSGALEASFNGGSYTTVNGGNPLTGGAFSFSLPAQAGGQGTFSIRPISDPLAIVTRTDVIITDVFLLIGQSNHQEQATNTKSYTGTGKALVWNKAARNSIWANMNGTEGVTQAYWPLFANSYATSVGRPCAFLEAAVGGTSVDQWQKTSTSIYNDATNNNPYGNGKNWNLYQRMQNMILDSNCGGVKGALWHQGEQDCTLGTSLSTYQSKLAQLTSDINSDLGITTGVAKLQVIKDIGANLISTANVNGAINNLWGLGGNIWTGPDFTDLTADLDGFGYLHIKNDTNVALQGSRWWTAAKAKYGYA